MFKKIIIINKLYQQLVIPTIISISYTKYINKLYQRNIIYYVSFTLGNNSERKWKKERKRKKKSLFQTLHLTLVKYNNRN